MKPGTFRDYAIGICAVIFVIIYTIDNIYYMHQASKTNAEQSRWFNSTQSDELGVYPSCEKLPEHYSAALEIENFGENEVKNIKCKIIDDGGLSSDALQQSIGSLTPGSQDVCAFILKGSFAKPVKLEVSFGNKVKRSVCTSFESFEVPK